LAQKRASDENDTKDAKRYDTTGEENKPVKLQLQLYPQRQSCQRTCLGNSMFLVAGPAMKRQPVYITSLIEICCRHLTPNGAAGLPACPARKKKGTGGPGGPPVRGLARLPVRAADRSIS
jgi:hypothetical protein